jgi:hypothetical protein
LASFASQWAEQQMEASDLTSTATLSDYFTTLAPNGADPGGMAWVALQNNSADNWTESIEVVGRYMAGGSTDTEPEVSVEGIIPPERLQRNPFNGASVFVVSNNPFTQDSVIPGALAFAYYPEEDDYYYYSFLFQGTDNTSHASNSADTYHAGQSYSLAGLRNGVFAARLAQ